MTVEPILVGEELIRDDGAPRQRVRATIDDPAVADIEQSVAAWVFKLLRAHYPGHLWFVDASVARGGVAIAIPVLMGGNWVYFIRGNQLGKAAVMRAGGEILERYRLRRGRLELGSFLAARGRHSILARAASEVPG